MNCKNTNPFFGVSSKHRVSVLALVLTSVFSAISVNADNLPAGISPVNPNPISLLDYGDISGLKNNPAALADLQYAAAKKYSGKHLSAEQLKAAAKELEQTLGTKVYLELYVKTIDKWRDREKYLNEFNFNDFTE